MDDKPNFGNIFLQRLTELPPDSFAVFYLTNFAIPFYQPIGWFITIGEIYSAIGLLIGLTTRSSALVSLFILFNFAIGGYYDASLLPFFILVLLFIKYPTGQWFGLDAILSRRFPNYKFLGSQNSRIFDSFKESKNKTTRTITIPRAKSEPGVEPLL